MTDNSSFDCRLDHLVVTAASCEDGVSWVAARSGVSLPKGGAHPLMGTHNHLSAIAADQFLEVIAIDPNAPKPSHNRWFELDDVDQQRILEQSPQLSTWVVATNNLDAALTAVRACGINPGEPVTLTRDELTWRLVLDIDGSLVFGGTFPILIEWPPGVNPVDRMQDQNLRLDKLELTHPDHEKLNRAFHALGISSLATVQQGPVALCAQMHIENHSFQLN